jgi:Fe-S-cluster containining protein
VILDPADLARLSAQKAPGNLAFRRFLKARHDDHHLLHVIGAEMESRIDCRQCAACCRETRVEVGSADLARIGAFLKLRPAEVERMYTERCRDRAELLLAQTAGECVFLDHSECLIYDARPPACRLFPYLTPLAASLGNRIESIWRRASYCPIVFHAIEEYKHRTGFHLRDQP